MRKKAKIFLVSSILLGTYLLYGIYNIITHISSYKVSDYVITIILYALIIKLEMFFFKKYKFYSNSKDTENEKNVKTLPDFKLKIKKGWVISIFVIGSLSLITLYTVKNSSTLGSPQESNFMKVTNTNNNQAAELTNILKECGINKIEKIDHDSSLDGMNVEGEKGYRLKADNVENIILYITKDNKVNIVRWADNFLYKNGRVVSKITDYIVNSDEASKLQVRCQNDVKSVLKAPSTAKFPNILDWKFSKNKERIIVQSYVDSQNSFGAQIRSEFQLTFSSDGSTVKSFIFEGQEYVK